MSRKGQKLTEEHKRKIGEANKLANPATIYDYECAGCGVAFQNRHKDRKYCSNTCYHKAKQYSLVCLGCNDVFKAKAPNAEYCQSCLTKECIVCEKEFVLDSGELKGGQYNPPRKYCSRACYHQAPKEKEPWNKKDPVVLNCVQCNNEFEVAEARKETAKYCSRQCKHNALSERTGEDHPLWKGGYTLYGRMLSENEGSFYRNRRLVLKRDNDTCQHCGHEGDSSYMDVHHIIPVRQGGSNTLHNMITLCRKCHNHADRKLIDQRAFKEYVESRSTDSFIRTR